MSVEAIAIIFAAIAVGAFAKGLTGIGLPAIGIPVLAGFLGVEHAIVVMTIPVFVSNVWIVWSYRRFVDAVPNLPLALVVAALGTMAGTYILAALDDRTLIYVLIVWVGLYLLKVTISPDFRIEGVAARRLSPILSLISGLSQGATGIAGPVVATWIHSYRLQAEAYVFGVSVMFLSISGIHMLSVSVAGLMDATRLTQGLLAIIPTLLMVPVGMRMTRLLSPKLFNRLILALIVTMEVRLIWKAVAGG